VPMVSALFVLGLAMYVAVPVVTFTGLRRCIYARTEQGFIFLPSLIGFGFGLSSVTLVFIAMWWGGSGFRYHDPRLLRIYGIGVLLSLAGLLAGLGGVWKKNPLQWHAPVLSLGMLLLWVLWAAGE
jgi:hypothetical protein